MFPLVKIFFRQTKFHKQAKDSNSFVGERRSVRQRWRVNKNIGLAFLWHKKEACPLTISSQLRNWDLCLFLHDLNALLSNYVNRSLFPSCCKEVATAKD